MLLLPERINKSSKNCSKTVQNRLPKASYNFSLSFPGPVKDCWGAHRFPPQTDPLDRVGLAESGLTLTAAKETIAVELVGQRCVRLAWEAGWVCIYIYIHVCVSLEDHKCIL